MEDLQTAAFPWLKNFFPVGMTGVYALLLFSPETIAAPHTRVIISQFIIFILPGFLVHRLTLNRSAHDLFEKLALSFLLSCFVFLVTGSAAYYFTVSHRLYLEFMLFLFICGSVRLVYQDRFLSRKLFTKGHSSPPLDEKRLLSPEKRDFHKVHFHGKRLEIHIGDLSLLVLTILLVVLFSRHKISIGHDAVDHIADFVKIADSGRVTPRDPFIKDWYFLSYLYSPYHLMVASIKRLSNSSAFEVWYHLPKVILFFLPFCYYSLVKSVFREKRLAYFAYLFILGLIISGYYQPNLIFPYPRRFLRELLAPVFYLALITYLRELKGEDLALLVISSMVMMMFHPSGIPIVVFNGLLCMILLLFFKGGAGNFKKFFPAMIAVILANLPLIAARVLTTSGQLLNSLQNATPGYWHKYATLLTENFFMMKYQFFFTKDNLFCYLVIICLILAQSNSALTLVMTGAALVVPVFLLFPPLATFFSRFFTANIMVRLFDLNIRPFFFICFLFFINRYGLKCLRYLEGGRTGDDEAYGTGILFLIGVSAVFLHYCFWVPQTYLINDVFSTGYLGSGEIFLIFLALASLPLFIVVNRKKKFNPHGQSPLLGELNLNKGSHGKAALFLPIIISLVWSVPKIKARMSESTNLPSKFGTFSLNEQMRPEFLEYIADHEKPRSVVILAENKEVSHQIPMYIPQFIANAAYRDDLVHERTKGMRFMTERIYDDDFPLDKTLELIKEHEIDYIVDLVDLYQQPRHRKFINDKKNFKLVYHDHEVYLYKIAFRD